MTFEFVKLKQGNDWGVAYYERHGADRGVCRTCDKDRDAIKSKPGQRVTVRFPDGTIAAHPLREVPCSERITDHGHGYDVSYGLLALEVVLCGVATTVSLDDVQVAVDEHGEFAEEFAQPGLSTKEWAKGDYILDSSEATRLYDLVKP